MAEPTVLLAFLDGPYDGKVYEATPEQVDGGRFVFNLTGSPSKPTSFYDVTDEVVQTGQGLAKVARHSRTV
ncbi:hypothetical protein ACFQ80_19080 [Isoptericola sp. NPDC056578]|uniref:hypothetical protein n=1 Tax=Isoptericola sp. NPDC056578 TaxID=3345870 RepID=UPI003687FBDF